MRQRRRASHEAPQSAEPGAAVERLCLDGAALRTARCPGGGEFPRRRAGRRSSHAAGGRHRLARVLHRPAAEAADRAVAAEQPRPARGGAEHRARARAVPDPARRAVPHRAAGRHRPGAAQRRRRQRLHRGAEHHRLRARPVRPRAQPERRGAAAVLRQRRGTQGGADQPDRRGGQHLPDAAGRRGAAGGGTQDAGIARAGLQAAEAEVRQRRAVRIRPGPGGDAGRRCTRRGGAAAAPAHAGRERAGAAGRASRCRRTCRRRDRWTRRA